MQRHCPASTRDTASTRCSVTLPIALSDEGAPRPIQRGGGSSATLSAYSDEMQRSAYSDEGAAATLDTAATTELATCCWGNNLEV